MFLPLRHVLEKTGPEFYPGGLCFLVNRVMVLHGWQAINRRVSSIRQLHERARQVYQTRERLLIAVAESIVFVAVSVMDGAVCQCTHGVSTMNT